ASSPALPAFTARLRERFSDEALCFLARAALDAAPHGLGETLAVEHLERHHPELPDPYREIGDAAEDWAARASPAQVAAMAWACMKRCSRSYLAEANRNLRFLRKKASAARHGEARH
ncbi:MAG: hypothetical protein AAFP17_10420, partial [Pseudomonadota bacterium]